MLGELVLGPVSQAIPLYQSMLTEDEFKSNWNTELVSLSNSDLISTSPVFEVWCVSFVTASIMGSFTKSDREMAIAGAKAPFLAFAKFSIEGDLAFINHDGKCEITCDTLIDLWREFVVAVRANNVVEAAWSFYRIGFYVEKHGQTLGHD